MSELDKTVKQFESLAEKGTHDTLEGHQAAWKLYQLTHDLAKEGKLGAVIGRVQEDEKTNACLPHVEFDGLESIEITPEDPRERENNTYSIKYNNGEIAGNHGFSIQK